MVDDLVAQRAKRLTDEKKQASSTRPGASTVDSEAPLESKTTRGATKEAASRILREMGLGDA
jgi:hypothetical protein